MSEAEFCCDEGAWLANKAQYEREHSAAHEQRKRKEVIAMNLKTMKTGDYVNLRMVLTKADIRKTKAGKPYLQATFSDGTDTVSGNIWDWSAALPELGVYDVAAIAGEYMGKKQLNNIDMHWSDNQDKSAFGVHYVDDVSGYIKMFNNFLALIKNDVLRNIVADVYNRVAPNYYSASSAVSVHHVGAGGNLVHTCEVALLASKMAAAMKLLGYDVNEELCIAGALLHDIGKIDTYEIDGPAVNMTLDGNMSDHIALGFARLQQSVVAQQHPDVTRLLGHIILSHHGSKEYGSPVTPKFMEAYVVSYADGLSAMMDTLRSYNTKAEEEQRPGIFTERIFTANNSEHLLQRAVYAFLQENSETLL